MARLVSLQPVDLCRRVREALFEAAVLALHLPRRSGEGQDQLLHGRRVGAAEIRIGLGQGLAIGLVRLLRLLDGGGDGFELLGELVAGVANLFVQALLGQVLGRKVLGHGFG